MPYCRNYAVLTVFVSFSPTAPTPHRLANRVHVHLSAGGVELAIFLHHFSTLAKKRQEALILAEVEQKMNNFWNVDSSCSMMFHHSQIFFKPFGQPIAFPHSYSCFGVDQQTPESKPFWWRRSETAKPLKTWPSTISGTGRSGSPPL